MKMIYLRVYNNRKLEAFDSRPPKVIDIKDDEETYQKVLQTDEIYITRRKIGNQNFTIIHDGDSFYMRKRKVSAVSNDDKIMIYGNIIIAPDILTHNGKFDGLTDEEISYINSKIHFHPIYQNYVLTDCNYINK
jgi:hypothetical protein